MKPENFPERVIWHTLLWTYGFFLIGGLYVVGSIVGWVLFAYLIRKLWLQTESTPVEEQIKIPLAVWIWVGGMLIMEVALIIGHLNFNLETSLMIKSSIGWLKGWALLAIFPLIGTLKIRPQLLYRIACIIGLQSLIFFPIFLLAYLLHFPQMPYTSPLQLIGGPGPEFFSPSFYELDPSNGQPRWRLFTPWAPALGFVANVYFFLALEERNKRWRWLGIMGAIFMCTVSVSRLALLSFPVVFALTKILSNLNRPFALVGLGVTSSISGILSPVLLAGLETFKDRFKSARANSSRVREILGRIAINRWQTEAPIWGHGTVEKGPHLVEYMPIGSHHTWYGLLFVKGIVGFAALAVPLIYSFLDLVAKAQTSQVAKVGLSMLLILFLYTFGENLEVLAYLYWPALLMMGIAFKERPKILDVMNANNEAQNFTSVR